MKIKIKSLNISLLILFVKQNWIQNNNKKKTKTEREDGMEYFSHLPSLLLLSHNKTLNEFIRA